MSTSIKPQDFQEEGKCKQQQISQISQLELQLSITQSGPSIREASVNVSPIKYVKKEAISKQLNQKTTGRGFEFNDFNNLDQQQQSNLLDSTIKQKKSLTSTKNVDLYKNLDTSNNGDANKSVISEISNQQSKCKISSSSNQIILQAQIIQLQMKCSTLMGIIHKMRKAYNIPIAELQDLDQKSQDKNDTNQLDSSLSLSSCNIANNNNQYSDLHDSKNLTQQINELVLLQKYVQEYRNQLKDYQKKINEMNTNYQERIKQLEIQANSAKEELKNRLKELENEKKCNLQMTKKNQQLILELESLSQKQSFPQKHVPFQNMTPTHSSKNESPSNIGKSRRKNHINHNKCSSAQTQKQIMPISNVIYKNYHPSTELDISINTKYSHMYHHPDTPSTNPQNKLEQSFSLREYQQCIKQMEIIINKLVRGLQAQRKSKQILLNETYRLCQAIKESEVELKQKNRKIYQLQKQMIANQARSLKKEGTGYFNPIDNKIKRTLIQNQRALSSHEVKSMSNSLSKQRYEPIYRKKEQNKSPFAGSNLRRYNSQTEQVQGKANEQIINSFSDYYDCYKQRQRCSEGRRTSNAYRLNKPQPSNNVLYQDYA